MARLTTVMESVPRVFLACRKQVRNPYSLALDQAASVLYIGTAKSTGCPTGTPPCQRIARLDLSTGVITTLLSTFPYNSPRQPYISGMAVAPSRVSLLFSDSSNSLVASVSLSPPFDVAVLAGKPTNYTFNGDGITATSAQLNNPQGLAVDLAGNIYIVILGSE